MRTRLLTPLAAAALALLPAAATAVGAPPLPGTPGLSTPANTQTVTQPVTQTTQPVTQATQPVTQATQPVTQAAQPVTQPVNQTVQTVQSAPQSLPLTQPAPSGGSGGGGDSSAPTGGGSSSAPPPIESAAAPVQAPAPGMAPAANPLQVPDGAAVQPAAAPLDGPAMLAGGSPYAGDPAPAATNPTAAEADPPISGRLMPSARSVHGDAQLAAAPSAPVRPAAICPSLDLSPLPGCVGVSGPLNALLGKTGLPVAALLLGLVLLSFGLLFEVRYRRRWARLRPLK